MEVKKLDKLIKKLNLIINIEYSSFTGLYYVTIYNANDVIHLILTDLEDLYERLQKCI